MNTTETLEECPTLHGLPTQLLSPTLSTNGLLAISLKTEKSSKATKFNNVIKVTNVNSKIKTTQITQTV